MEIQNQINNIEMSGGQIIYNIKNQISKNKIKLLSGSENKILIINIDGDLNVDFDHEENAKSDIQIVNIYKSHKTRVICNSNLINGSSSDIYMLSLLTDGSDIEVDGNIFMAPGAVGSGGHLLEENLILSPNVRIYAKPVLDVQNSQVSASHGARISKIDNKNLFYMMSRGLSREQATEIIIDGYINKILDKMDLSDDQKLELKNIILS